MKYHTLFLPKTRNGIAKIVVCCSRDGALRVKGQQLIIVLLASGVFYHVSIAFTINL